MAGGGEAAGVRERARVGRGDAERATDREVSVVAAVIAAGSEKAAAHWLGLSHSTVKRRLANARSMVGATMTAQLVCAWDCGCRYPRERSSRTSAGLRDARG